MGCEETVRGFESKIKTPIMITITIMITIKERGRHHCYRPLRGVFCAARFCRMDLIAGSRARGSCAQPGTSDPFGERATGAALVRSAMKGNVEMVRALLRLSRSGSAACDFVVEGSLRRALCS